MNIFQIIESVALVITILGNFVVMGYIWGRLTTEIEAIKEEIKIGNDNMKENIQRLERKQDRHNGLYEKVTRCEESTKSAHHRLDAMESRGK